MECCAFKRDLNEIIQVFYSCTQLPITAVTTQGRFSSQVSYLDLSLGDDELTKHHGSQGEVPASTHGNGALLYIVPICPCAKMPGFFVLGPYCTSQPSDLELTYRPQEVWPPLVSLLRSLQGLSMGAKHAQTGRNSGACRPNCLPIYRAKKIIHKYYDKNLSLESTAKRLGLNKSYLSTLFSTEMGQTFTEYVQEVRVQKSKELLADYSLSILDVALGVGFTSQNYFTRTFKKLTGITPSEFRQQQDQVFKQ